MKVFGISGSPIKDGNVDTLSQQVLKGEKAFDLGRRVI
jgi:multimeric flavodoxin WrbA